MPAGERRATRVLFVAWGPSIHAVRRIGPFAGDERFEVGLVSTHDYGFENVRSYLLDGTPGVRPRGEGKRSFRTRIVDRLRWEAAGLAYRFLARRESGLNRAMAEGWFNDRDRLLAAVREFRPDVLFLQTLMYPSYLAFSAPRRIPVVVTFWNGDVLWWAQWNGIERRLKKWIVRHGARKAAAVTVNSEAAAEACRRYGAKAERIHILRYPGVDTERFRPRPKDEAKASLGIAGRKVILCPRGIGGYLNSDVIVASAAAVARAFPEVLFLFLSASGNDESMPEHRRAARESGVEGNIRWEGRVPWDAMPAYYGAADAMVSVSSNDSLPNCMLEAMACGVPVVMGDIPSIREWVEDGKNGCLVPPRDPSALADALVGLLRDGGEAAAAFALTNRARILEDADSCRNLERVKVLVLSAAGVK